MHFFGPCSRWIRNLGLRRLDRYSFGALTSWIWDWGPPLALPSLCCCGCWVGLGPSGLPLISRWAHGSSLFRCCYLRVGHALVACLLCFMVPCLPWAICFCFGLAAGFALSASGFFWLLVLMMLSLHRICMSSLAVILATVR